MADRSFITSRIEMNSIEDLARQFIFLEGEPYVTNRFFTIYYGFGTWTVCMPDGELESASATEHEAALRTNLLNFLYFGD